MSKIRNKLKAKKTSSIDKVDRRMIRAQNAFDEAAEQKWRDDYECDVPRNAPEEMNINESGQQ